MPIVFNVYESELTHAVTQEWQIRIGMYAINYHSNTPLTLDEARAKIAEITATMSYISSITNINITVPRKVWQDDF